MDTAFQLSKFFIIECLYTHVNTVFMCAVFQIVLKQT